MNTDPQQRDWLGDSPKADTLNVCEVCDKYFHGTRTRVYCRICDKDIREMRERMSRRLWLFCALVWAALIALGVVWFICHLTNK
jgi:hypothetical protein